VRALALAGVLLASDLFAQAGMAASSDVLRAVVGLHAVIAPDARTADSLGRERRGSGVVIDASGLVLTIGYLVLEASGVDLVTTDGRTVPAEVVAYDAESGLGLLRATARLGAPPVRLGSSAGLEIDQPVLAVSDSGRIAGVEARVVDRRTFAAPWEYLLDDAIYTSPPLPEFGGAALFDAEGRLVGIGSLLVGDAVGPGLPSPGNLFVPIDALKPVLGDLLAFGRRSGPAQPWLGVTAGETHGRLMVAAVASDGPADKAGLRPGDLILAVGGAAVASLADFYRKVRAVGAAGVTVPLTVLRDGGMHAIGVTSMDRLRWFKLQQTF
jgi:S1-C subfamily serine protease